MRVERVELIDHRTRPTENSKRTPTRFQALSTTTLNTLVPQCSIDDSTRSRSSRARRNKVFSVHWCSWRLRTTSSYSSLRRGRTETSGSLFSCGHWKNCILFFFLWSSGERLNRVLGLNQNKLALSSPRGLQDKHRLIAPV